MKDIYIHEPLKKIMVESNKQSFTLTKISRLRYQNNLLILINYLPKKAKVLDLGCGSGHIMAALKYLRPDVSIVGINPLKDYLWPTVKKQFNVSFKIGTGSKLPFKNNYFDAVLSIGVMEHVHEYYKGKGDPEESYLKEIYRVLKKKGIFFITHLPNKYSFNENVAKLIGVKPHAHPYSKKQAIKSLNKQKFHVELFHREHFIPSYFNLVSGFIGSFMNKGYWFVINLDKFLMLTPLRLFCQSFLIVARKK